ncbi:hypothetical protein TREMEDRAFT_59440 [Tremella mesenterica DSM 1558]|nr:uncharacterized protein TREMEDRAFT_59440 [Tremella mesenterica DSM 1558]EIW73275.1 hypothetical protein TREMEDRAFT_59440 [Tremella mesenterica DSM 1558]
MSPLPSVPPVLPHSTSFPSLSAPHQKPISQDYHPYAIRSSASAALTRSNASPTQPLSVYRHRPCRSMSALSQPILPESPIGSPEADGAWRKDKEWKERHNKLKDVETPSKTGDMRRSQRFQSFESLKSEEVDKGKDPELPIDPRTWTPSHLAAYLGWTLRTGGPSGNGQTLPLRLVEDIKSWVFRGQISGQMFLKGNAEEWSHSGRPPPFMPFLLAVSRRLRRASLRPRPISSNSFSFPMQNDHPSGSVVLEEDEFPDAEDEDDDGLTGVRRMAHAFDNLSSASEASGDEDNLESLGIQLTGESTTGYGRRKELKRHHTGGSSNAAYDHALRRFESRDSTGGIADTEASPVISRKQLSKEPELLTVESGDEEKGGTVKRAPDMLASSSSSSPPPPYASPELDTSSRTMAEAQSAFESNNTPETRTTRLSVDPTPERPQTSTPSGLGLGNMTSPLITVEVHMPSDQSQSEDPTMSHMGKMEQHFSTGIDPYAALRQPSSSSSSKRYPTIRHVPSTQPIEDSQSSFEMVDSPTDHKGSSRRVTIRASKLNDLFRPTEREKELETR